MDRLTRPRSKGQQATEATIADSTALENDQVPASPLAMQSNGARVAIVHHWFLSHAGGERVFNSIASMFPAADVFTLFLDKQKFSAALHNRKITTSFLDKIPAAQKAHRHFLPFYPLAVEMLDLSGYDLVISSDSGPMKGVLTDPHSTHICYCHSPMRYLWDGHIKYHRDMSPLIRTIFGVASHYVRNWDYSAAQRVDHFIANSHYVAARIRKYYRRESTIIHPPINTRESFLSSKVDNYYLAVGRLVPYKRTDIIVNACAKLGRKLVIVGDGPERKRLERHSPKNIEFLGELDDSALRNVYARARALLFAADEDFGLVPLEAQSYGRPVIAFGKGGSLETVIGAFAPINKQTSGEDTALTGLFFDTQTTDSLVQAILCFESSEERFSPMDAQTHAQKFDTSVFLDRMHSFVNSVTANRER